MDFFRRHKRLFIISLSALCAVLIIITTLSKANPTVFGNVFAGVTAPLQSGLNAVGGWISGRVEFFTSMSELYDENQRLKNENAVLKQENSRLRQVEADNEAMAKMLNTHIKYSYPDMYARVIGSDPGNWYKSFSIDIGTDDGVVKNMSVIADGALVGFVSEARAGSSKVSAIINGNTSVSAKLTRTEDIGVVKGDADLMLDGLCMMEFNDLTVDVMVGDEVRTSQISSMYPPDILIGTVTEVSIDAKGMKSAVIQPSADFSRIESVLVIMELYDEEVME